MGWFDSLLQRKFLIHKASSLVPLWVASGAGRRVDPERVSRGWGLAVSGQQVVCDQESLICHSCPSEKTLDVLSRPSALALRTG